MKHRTARGLEFNMQSFASSQGDTIAVGNSGRNARGDLIGPGGKIIASSQQIEKKSSTSTESKKVNLNLSEYEVGRREVVGADGSKHWEVKFADGSIEVIPQENQKVNIDREPNLGDL
jgi:predicted RNA-binding protein Jag